MQIKTPINKKNIDKKTSAVQRADTLDFIREAISDSRSVVSDITRVKHSSESSVSRIARKDSASIYYGN